MITDYQLVREFSLGVFHKEVKKLIADGWQPLGGVSVVNEVDPHFLSSDTPISYTQAMVLQTAKANDQQA